MQGAKALFPEGLFSAHKRNLSLFQILFDNIVKYDMDTIGVNKSCFKWISPNLLRNESNKHGIISIFNHRNERGASNWAWASVRHYTVTMKYQIHVEAHTQLESHPFVMQ